MRGALSHSRELELRKYFGSGGSRETSAQPTLNLTPNLSAELFTDKLVRLPHHAIGTIDPPPPLPPPPMLPTIVERLSPNFRAQFISLKI